MTEAAPPPDGVDAVPRRLHPLTLLLGIAGLLPKSLNMLPVIIGLGVTGGGRWIGPALAAWLLGSLVYRILAWRRFSWTVDADDVTIASGILSRQTRTIPFDRIQDVTIEQGVLARLLGLAKVGFETGSSGGDKQDEATLDAIALPEAEALRDHIRRHRVPEPTTTQADAAPAATIAVEDRPLFAMPPQRLVLAGLFNFSLAIFAVLFGLLQSFDDWLPFDPFSVDLWEQMLAGTALESWVVAHRWLAAVGGALTLAALGFATGIVRTLLSDWDFRLDRAPRGFRRRRGLLTRTDVAVPIARVQAAVVGTGWVRRRLGWYALGVQSLASDSAEQADHILAPFARLAEIDPILSELAFDRAGLEDGHARTAAWQRSHAAMVWLPALGAAVAAALVIALLLTLDRLLADTLPARAAYLPYALPLAPLAVAALGWVSWRHRLWHFDGRLLHIADGFTAPRHTILPARNVQSADLTIGPLQRRLGTASLLLGVPGGEHRVESIPLGAARQLRAALLAAR
jgi:putative membrane protein